MVLKKINPFSRFNIEQSDYLEKPLDEYKTVQLRIRALIFLLDYGLFTLLIYGTYQFINLFISDVPDSILYTLIGFYSIIFITIENYFDGTIFKILFNLRTISTKGKKLKIQIYIFKYILRPIALALVVIYLFPVSTIIVYIIYYVTGLIDIFWDFLDGKMGGVWYDKYINQMVIKMPAKNG
ncbi:RDD family protein [Mesoflavibacter sp. CH_XMU1404-2]|uniref:RDD family protein n=1 Tax=Mesoflavibacter sp. CH_XMU1404-2 TaxID=3107766 RepID=UPI003009F1A5